jgi:hypothetical protein
MLDWSVIGPGIVALFAEAIGPTDEPGWEPEWQDRAEASRFASLKMGGSVYLKVGAVITLGNDETRQITRIVRQDDVDVEVTTEIICGLRRFTLQVQAVEAGAAPLQWANSKLEKLRTYLDNVYRPRLIDMNLDLTDYGAINTFTQVMMKRRHITAAIDITLTGAFNVFDAPQSGWIERVLLTSHANVASVELSAPLNYSDEKIGLPE